MNFAALLMSVWRTMSELAVNYGISFVIYASMILGVAAGFCLSVSITLLISLMTIMFLCLWGRHIQNKIRNYVPKGRRGPKFNPDDPRNDLPNYSFVVMECALFLGTTWITKLLIWVLSHIYWK